jgi:hypothetical protein
MESTATRRFAPTAKLLLLFAAGLFVGWMAYTGDLSYTVPVLVLAGLAVAVGRYTSS